MMTHAADSLTISTKHIRLFLCGDTMTGRGIDQILPYPSDPHLYEPYVNDAQQYVEIAEAANGSIPKPVSFSYIWGDALTQLENLIPDIRIFNLETSITRSDSPWPGKGIHYRMHPKNVPCITAIGADCCVLANNHVMDWGYEGLKDTLQTLHEKNIKTAGAGANLAEAKAPVVVEVTGKGNVTVLSVGLESSGIPQQWSATRTRPGINLLSDLSNASVQRIKQDVQTIQATQTKHHSNNIMLVSIHWGSNWGYEIPAEHIEFAHALIDIANVDIIHGHSSHHALGIEVYHDRPIIYGCGDFFNDYEGISGNESYRDDLSLMYLVDIDPTSRKLVGLQMIPYQIRKFRLNTTSNQDRVWLRKTLNREGKKFNTHVNSTEDGILVMYWH